VSKTVSVCLSFDFDAVSIWIGPMHSKSPNTISRGEFGVVRTERLLDVLRRHQVLASWFIPGHTTRRIQRRCKRLRTLGMKSVTTAISMRIRLRLLLTKNGASWSAAASEWKQINPPVKTDS
jgi:hypothetical protein